jgi:hypothetical protein
MLTISVILFIATKGIAAADILILTGCAHFIPLENMGIFITITGATATLFGLCNIKTKQTKIPLIPFILLGMMGCNFL